MLKDSSVELQKSCNIGGF